MVKTATLSFAESPSGAKTTFNFGDVCWTADYSSLEDAITVVFLNNIVNTEEACDALAVERQMIPWRKSLEITPLFLQTLGFRQDDCLQ